MRRYAVLLVFAALTVGFAPAPLPRPERRGPGVNEMEGRWESGATKVHITHNRFTHSDDYDYELRTDRTARPMTFDLRGIGRQNQSYSFTGIYKVEGDTLTLSYNSGTGNRPTSFAGQGAGYTQVYKRISR